MFKKTYNQINIGDNLYRHRVTIEDEVETHPNSLDSRKRFFALLQLLVDTPDLLTTGNKPVPDSFKIYHNAERWVLDMEAETDG